MRAKSGSPPGIPEPTIRSTAPTAAKMASSATVFTSSVPSRSSATPRRSRRGNKAAKTQVAPWPWAKESPEWGWMKKGQVKATIPTAVVHHSSTDDMGDSRTRRWRTALMDAPPSQR